MAAFVIPMVAPIMASHSLFLRGLLHSGIYFFVLLGLVIPSLILAEAAQSAITRPKHALPPDLATQQELRVWFNDRWWTLLPTAPIIWAAFHKTYSRQHDIVALAVAGLIAVAYRGPLYARRRKTA